MNCNARVMRRPRRVWLSAARTPAAIIVIAALVPLAAACSGSPSSTASGGSPTAGGSGNSPLLAFAQCMRSNRVPNFPDPQASGGTKFPSPQQLGVSSSQYQAADNDCQHLLPAGSNDEFPPAEVQLLLIGMRSFSQCVRSHGVPNWPDPTTDSEGRPIFDLGAAGISRSDFHSAQVQNRLTECQNLLPGALGGTPVGGS